MIRFDRSGLRPGFGRRFILDLLERGLATIDPRCCVRRVLHCADGRLQVGPHAFNLDRRRVWGISIGKAAVPMAEALTERLGGALAGGVLLTRYGYGGQVDGFLVREAGHPIPDENGVLAAAEIARMTADVGPDDLVICLLSGGGSALLAAPQPGVTIDDLAVTTDLLIQSGAAIDETNTVRRHLSTLQGGQLARRLQPATVITLALSDVIGDRLEAIASGPTAPDPTCFGDAIGVLHRYRLWERSPALVRKHLERGMAGEVDDTVNPGDPVFRGSAIEIVGNNDALLDALEDAGRAAGCRTLRAVEPVRGEARHVARDIARCAVDLVGGDSQRTLYIAGGETTVTVRGNGRGGRNQELALAAALEIDGIEGLCIAALATDGSDGVTEAAGAIIDGRSADTIRRAGIDPEAALHDNDSHAALKASGDLLQTGPTRTNIADACIVLIDSS